MAGKSKGATNSNLHSLKIMFNAHEIVSTYATESGTWFNSFTFTTMKIITFLFQANRTECYVQFCWFYYRKNLSTLITFSCTKTKIRGKNSFFSVFKSRSLHFKYHPLVYIFEYDTHNNHKVNGQSGSCLKWNEMDSEICKRDCCCINSM